MEVLFNLVRRRMSNKIEEREKSIKLEHNVQVWDKVNPSMKKAMSTTNGTQK